MNDLTSKENASDMVMDGLFCEYAERAEEIMMDDGDEWKQLSKLHVYAILNKRKKFEEEYEKIIRDLDHV